MSYSEMFSQLPAPIFLARFDTAISSFVAQNTSPAVERLAWVVTTAGDTHVVAALGVMVGLGFLIFKRWRMSAVMLLSVGSTVVAILIIKNLFLRNRPGSALEVIIDDPSFPSGHAGLAAAFFLAAVYIGTSFISTKAGRMIWTIVCGVAVLAIGLSRIILNVHWASDVIVGWAIGLFLVICSIIFVKYLERSILKKQM